MVGSPGVLETPLWSPESLCTSLLLNTNSLRNPHFYLGLRLPLYYSHRILKKPHCPFPDLDFPAPEINSVPGE